MFISKLRKKLKDDPTIALVNVHGQGYKLEVL
jgi:DNA-binding response OmpR family regulator